MAQMRPYFFRMGQSSGATISTDFKPSGGRGPHQVLKRHGVKAPLHDRLLDAAVFDLPGGVILGGRDWHVRFGS